MCAGTAALVLVQPIHKHAPKHHGPHSTVACCLTDNPLEVHFFSFLFFLLVPGERSFAERGLGVTWPRIRRSLR